MLTPEERAVVAAAEEMAGISEVLRMMTRQADYIRLLEDQVEKLSANGRLHLIVDRWNELFGLICEELVITFNPAERKITVEGVDENAEKLQFGGEPGEVSPSDQEDVENYDLIF